MQLQTSAVYFFTTYIHIFIVNPLNIFRSFINSNFANLIKSNYSNVCVYEVFDNKIAENENNKQKAYWSLSTQHQRQKLKTKQTS